MAELSGDHEGEKPELVTVFKKVNRKDAKKAFVTSKRLPYHRDKNGILYNGMQVVLPNQPTGPAANYP